MAKKYFNDVSAVGKNLRITDTEGTNDYRVSAVMKTPKSTDFGLDAIRLITAAHIEKEEKTNWHSYSSTKGETFFYFETPADAARFDAKLTDFLDNKAARSYQGTLPHDHIHLRLLPLTAMHLHTARERTAVATLGLVGLLAFGIALINYINLATARSGLRAKEVAVRKTLGANNSRLRLQFLVESCLTTILASLIGVSFVELTLPQVNSWAGLNLALDYTRQWSLWLSLLGGVILAGLLAGLYPAIVLSAFRPAQVLASARAPSGGRLGNRVRSALVVVQFSVVVVFFAMVLGFTDQIRHMKSSDVGYRREGLLLTKASHDSAVSEEQRRAFWTALRALPNVEHVTASDEVPGDDDERDSTSYTLDGRGEKISIKWCLVGADYFETFGTKLLAGRFPSAEFAADQVIYGKTDQTEGMRTQNIVINLQAARELGFASPDAAIGHLLQTPSSRAEIVGVVGDMRFHTPQRGIPPTIFFFDINARLQPITAVRFNGISESEMRGRMTELWRTIVPAVPIEVVSVIDNLDKNYYAPDRNRSNLFSIGAMVAALIGCVGLYGLAAFTTAMRTREIGLRKVLGASRGQVVKLLVGQFLRPVLFANLVAWPVGYWVLSNWLGQFDDRISLNPLHFLLPTALASVIAVITVGGLAYGGASTEPGKALRYE
jgi:putative ABC transport system permease protein